LFGGLKMVDESIQAEDQPSDPVNSAADTASQPEVAEAAPAATSTEVADEQVEAGIDSQANEATEAADDIDSEIRPEDLADPDEFEEDEFEGDAQPIEEDLEGDDEVGDYDWYILKVQSNREKSICAGLQRRVSVAGVDELFKEIIVPTEDVAEFKNGKRRVVKRKLYPGYIVVNMVLNDETWFLVRDTPGIGDFTGAAGKPTAMLPEEVDRIVKAARPEEEGDEQIKTAIPFKPGDRVRIKEGTFENFEGDVEGIDEGNGRVTVTINIFGRSTPVELEHWQIENV